MSTLFLWRQTAVTSYWIFFFFLLYYMAKDEIDSIARGLNNNISYLNLVFLFVEMINSSWNVKFPYYYNILKMNELKKNNKNIKEKKENGKRVTKKSSKDVQVHWKSVIKCLFIFQQNHKKKQKKKKIRTNIMVSKSSCWHKINAKRSHCNS